ncbi:MAG: PHD finger [Trebouxia sp. A1-2]|nr:MAG: PHD finger [Trebouxia sp. A1-2]
MRVPEDVFEDFKGRRKGILRALTTDVDRLYEECDPEAENLCLYGNPDGQWVVDLPAEEVPPEMPEPSLGYEAPAFLSLGMPERLFELINDLPTCYEIVSGRSSQAASRPSNRKRAPAPMARPGPGQPKFSRPMHPQSRPQARPAERGSAPRHTGYDEDDDEEDEDDDDADGGFADGEGDPCPNCGRVYRTGDFWIQCDFCDTWYDGKCVQMTPGKAQRMGKWKCPACERRMG